MRTSANILFCIIVLALSSCIVVGWSSGIKNIPDSYQPLIVDSRSIPIDSLKQDRRVHIVTEAQIQEYIATHDSVLVQLWVAVCNSPSCTNPRTFEDYCIQHNYSPLCILCYFDIPASFALYDAVQMPCLFLDINQYSKDRVTVYSQEMHRNLTGNDTFNPKYWLFSEGKFSRYINKLEFSSSD